MKKFLLHLMITLCLLSGACTHPAKQYGDILTHELYGLVAEAPGTVGIAYVSQDDTVLVNNGIRYPMMSVFKLHQALAVADALERQGVGFDTLLSVSARELDPDTWSPMLKTYTGPEFDISVGELVNLALVSSDNNASNLLFSHIVLRRRQTGSSGPLHRTPLFPSGILKRK